jgi:hypothetical protein
MHGPPCVAREVLQVGGCAVLHASTYLAFDWSLLRSGKIKMLFPDARVRGD